MYNVKLFVEEGPKLTAKGWEVAEKLGNAIEGYKETQQWAKLHQWADANLKGNEEDRMFLLSIARKIANGEIEASAPISIDIDI